MTIEWRTRERPLVRPSLSRANESPSSASFSSPSNRLYGSLILSSLAQRIMDAAENLAMSSEHKEADRTFSYYNAKEFVEPGAAKDAGAAAAGNGHGPESDGEKSKAIEVPEVPPKELVLHPDPHFFNQHVNTNYSSVHVPTNVFDRCE